MLASVQKLSLVLSFALTMSACGHKDDNPAPTAAAKIEERFDDEVTAENYLNGKAFCKEYSEETRTEYPMIIKVPEDYANPDGPALEIYTWTLRPFNPNLPSVLMTDGGPGQNGHGFGSSIRADWNEIHFDQRGLGCSAPETFEQYKNQKYFSTANTVRDMDEIRKAYKIDKWSVFGVSYGTVPATEYGSQFKNQTVALTLEGTLFSAEDLHSSDWKIEKWNAVLAKLNEAQQRGFGELIVQEKYQPVFMAFLHKQETQPEGFREALDSIKALINTDGKVDYKAIDEAMESSRKRREQNKANDPHAKYAQTPGGIDLQIHLVIQCKDLGYENIKSTFGFNPTTLRFVVTADRNGSAICDRVGVPKDQRKFYKASEFPVSSPVTYFQGSHDGATLTRGAYKHFSSVPQGLANFLLNTKGGHNPLSYSVLVEGGGSQILVDEHRKLFAKSLEGKKITQNDVDHVNGLRTGGGNNKGVWKLIDKTPASEKRLKDEMDGIRRDVSKSEDATL